MKKKVIATIMALALCSGLVGCGGSDTGKTGESSGKKPVISEKVPFDAQIIVDMTDFTTIARDQQKIMLEVSNDGKITDDEKKQIKEVMNKYNAAAQKIKETNKKSTDEVFKNHINAFAESTDKGVKLFLEGVENEDTDKLLEAQKALAQSAVDLQNASKRIQEIQK